MAAAGSPFCSYHFARPSVQVRHLAGLLVD
jgi:hypothetical protein